MSDAKKIRERIEAACLSEMELLPKVAQDVSFHMTAWLDDLRRYVDFCNSPDAYSTEQVRRHGIVGVMAPLDRRH